MTETRCYNEPNLHRKQVCLCWKKLWQWLHFQTDRQCSTISAHFV